MNQLIKSYARIVKLEHTNSVLFALRSVSKVIGPTDQIADSQATCTMIIMVVPEISIYYLG